VNDTDSSQVPGGAVPQNDRTASGRMTSTSRAMLLIAAAMLSYAGISEAQTTGIMSTLAGNGTGRFGGDGGLATGANVNGPARVAVDTAGNVYIAETTGSAR